MILYIENTKEFTHTKKYFCCSVIKSCLTICNPRNYSILGFLSFTISQSLFKLMSIESSNQLILCRPFTSCPQSIPASGSFPMSWLFVKGGHSIGASASASVLPMTIQVWFPLGLANSNTIMLIINPKFLSCCIIRCNLVCLLRSLQPCFLLLLSLFLSSVAHFQLF